MTDEFKQLLNHTPKDDIDYFSIARGIFRDVNEMIKKIDEEIEAFCMKVSDQGKVFIFLVT